MTVELVYILKNFAIQLKISTLRLLRFYSPLPGVCPSYKKNALHESLIRKDTNSFWRSWRSKFDCYHKSFTTEGTCDGSLLTEKFSAYFSEIVCPNYTGTASDREHEITSMFESYKGHTCYPDNLFVVENIDDAIGRLKCGKAVDLDGLGAEHLINCHQVIVSIITRLFNLIMYCSHVPRGFCVSYNIPLLKIKDHLSQSLTCNDFRGIAISNIISKVFEYCIFDKFSSYFLTDSRQFGFKKNSGCNNAIYTVRTIVDDYIDGACTANLCALDLSKAFDKVNHKALFIKLMNRNLPLVVLSLLINWLPICSTCVKWDNFLSDLFALAVGIRQGSVLAPLLFSVYVNDIISCCTACGYGEVLIYADDILLISRSIYIVAALCLHTTSFTCSFILTLLISLNGLRLAKTGRNRPRSMNWAGVDHTCGERKVERRKAGHSELVSSRDRSTNKDDSSIVE
jgi:hypothetical protein